MAENRPNPKSWNGGKSPQILKDGIFSKIKNVYIKFDKKSVKDKWLCNWKIARQTG